MLGVYYIVGRIIVGELILLKKQRSNKYGASLLVWMAAYEYFLFMYVAIGTAVFC